MTSVVSRTECVVDGARYVEGGGGPPGFTDLVVGDGPVIPGVERIAVRGRECVRVPHVMIERRLRIDVLTEFERVPAVVTQVLGDRAELYNGTGEGGRAGWDGNMHDGWSKWVPVSELGEVTESVQELDAEGNRLS